MDEKALEQLEKRVCVVCRKRLRHGDMYAHLRFDNEMCSVCCVVCYEVFQRDPAAFIMRARTREGRDLVIREQTED